MLSPETEQRITQHLRLARGLLGTASIRLDSSEYEERNALSRTYYAMFHASAGWLLSVGVELDKLHGPLHGKRKQGIELDFIVRALWAIGDVRHAGKTLSGAGGFRDAEAFIATLISGQKKAGVEVDVTSAAWDEIVKETKGRVSASEIDLVSEVVKEFLKLRLSFGGANYWGPLTPANSQLDLTPADVPFRKGGEVPQANTGYGFSRQGV